MPKFEFTKEFTAKAGRERVRYSAGHVGLIPTAHARQAEAAGAGKVVGGIEATAAAADEGRGAGRKRP